VGPQRASCPCAVVLRQREQLAQFLGLAVALLFEPGGPVDLLRKKIAAEPSVRGGKSDDDDEDEESSA
jgi:hypothetical protein